MFRKAQTAEKAFMAIPENRADHFRGCRAYEFVIKYQYKRQKSVD